MAVTVFMILLFIFLILIHEFGHFIIAKAFNVKVNEFSVGMGKLLFKKQKGETQYSIRAIPVGGYCKLEGEDYDNEDKRSFRNTNPLIKILIIMAGPFINFLFGVLLFTIIHFNMGASTTIVKQSIPNSPAYQLGIKENDILLSFNDKQILQFNDFINELNLYYMENDSNTPSEISFLRENEVITKEFKPLYKNNSPFFGIEVKTQKLNLGQSIKHGFISSMNIIKDITDSLKALFKNNINIVNVSGPVGLINTINNDTKSNSNIFDLLNLMAYISINIFFFNLIPFPLLDGFKIVESIIEIIIGRPIKQNITTTITTIGAILLIALILTITIKDLAVMIFSDIINRY